jgi:hypothetical protein
MTRWLFAGFIIPFLIVNVIVTHIAFTEPFPALNDFMSRWEGARSFWVDGLNPYGNEASLNIQERIYGRPALESEDPGYFAYPFYTVFLVWPLVYLPYSWASAIWMVFLEVCLVGALLLILDLLRWRPRPWLLAILIIWTLLAYYPSRGLILGQPGLVVYFLEILTLWALVKKRDTLAGVALALSTIKPQMGFLFVPFLLLWGLYSRRWRFVFGTIVSLGILLVVSFILQPSWLSDWLQQIGIYTDYTALGSPVWIVMQYYLGLSTIGEWMINLAFYGLMIWTWKELFSRPKSERFLWTAAFTLTITHLVATRTATPHYVIFIFPFLFYLREIAQGNRRIGSYHVALILAVLLFIPWLHAIFTVQNKFEHPTVYLPVPFIMVILLWVTRHWWWKADSAVEITLHHNEPSSPTLI